MTQEDKELLTKDICARVLYGVKAQYYDSENECLDIDTIEYVDISRKEPEVGIGQYGIDIDKVKPLLRPLSSLTEQEIIELGKIDMKRIIFSSRHLTYHLDGEIVDWFNKNHIDFRGLIPNGLAIAVTEDNNQYKL